MKIKDIAQKAGVSTATVSNVINGNYHKVSQATVDKVKKIIDEIGKSGVMIFLIQTSVPQKSTEHIIHHRTKCMLSKEIFL